MSKIALLIPTPYYLIPIVQPLYHYFSIVNQTWAERFAKLLGLGRHVVITDQGKYWIDPLSNFGEQLTQQGEYEPEMINVLDRYLFAGAVFVDLGANEGYFSILASKRCGPTGKVYAIEPQLRCQEVILENCRLNQCANISIPNCVEKWGSKPGRELRIELG